MPVDIVLENAEVTQEEIDNFPVVPYGVKLCVKEHKVKQIGSIIVPDTAQNSDMKTNEGTVIAVGEHVDFCKVGDHVYYSIYSGSWMPRVGDTDQKVYRIMNEEDLLGKVKEAAK